jgi:hypothetical protein
MAYKYSISYTPDKWEKRKRGKWKKAKMVKDENEKR